MTGLSNFERSRIVMTQLIPNSMQYRHFILTLILSLGTISLFAQSMVEGTVVDASGQPLIGAGVVVSGTSRGAVTDIDGNFSLEAGAGELLQFSCIGFVSQTLPATPGTPMRVVLLDDTQLLDEVVVVGYGVQRKSDVTGAIASVKTDEIQNRATDNVGKAIQGKVSGVQVLTLSGAPGKETHFRVRGYSSNSDMTEPLYLVDGLKVGDISYLGPENIESIEILKDAASAAIYGAEAGNGVVLITTKSGKKGTSRIFYNGMYSLQQASKKVEMLTADEFRQFWTDAGISADQFQNGNTDWQDVIFGSGYLTQHTIGAEGANDKGSFFVSLSYLDNDGIITGSYDVNQRWSAQFNASYHIRDWFTVGTTNSIEYRKLQQVPDNYGTGLTSTIGGAYLYDPTTPLVYESDADAPADLLRAEAEGWKVLRDAQGRLFGSSIIERFPGNPYGELVNGTEMKSQRASLNGTVYVNINPSFLKELVFTSRLGYRIAGSQGENSNLPVYWNISNKREYADMMASVGLDTYYQWENFANFSKDFDSRSHINAMVGMQMAHGTSRNVSGSTSQLVSDAPNFRNLDASAASATKGIGGRISESGNMSWFGRLGYTYDGRYVINANFRADAYDLSKLSKKNRWGFFPSFSAGWIASGEKFMQPVKEAVGLSFLKFRGSWGINGNVNSLSGYAHATQMNLSTGNNYTLSDYQVTGAAVSDSLANEDLSWEKSTQWDLGFESRFFADKLTFNVDYYNKVTTDLLTVAPAPYVSGASTQFVNMGRILNRGVDIELGWKQQIGDFSYSLDGNLSFLHNEVLESPYDYHYAGGGGYMTDATYFDVGYPIWYFRTYMVDHIDESSGMPVYKEPDTDDGKDFTGSAIPKATYGITLSAQYKGFDLRIFGAGQYGNKLYWSMTRMNPTMLQSNFPKAVVGGWWSWSNTQASRPTPVIWKSTTNLHKYGSSDAMLYDASFFAIKEIQLGYTLPKKWAERVKMQGLRLYCSLENFFVFTGYPGNSPETMAGLTQGAEDEFTFNHMRSGMMGIDRLSYPAVRQVVLGVNVSF